MRYTAWFWEKENAKISKGKENDNSHSKTTTETENVDQPQWMPFSKSDSARIENAYLNDNLHDPVLIDGTSYIVDLVDRTMTSTYYGTHAMMSYLSSIYELVEFFK